MSRALGRFTLSPVELTPFVPFVLEAGEVAVGVKETAKAFILAVGKEKWL